MSIFKSTATFRDFQRSEYALRHFIRFVAAKLAITYAMDLMVTLYTISFIMIMLVYSYFDEWIGLVDEFVECVRNGRIPKINLDWHKNTIAAMNACYESITTGKAVKL